MLLSHCAPFSGWVKFCVGREPPIQGGRGIGALHLLWLWSFLASCRVGDSCPLVWILVASLLGINLWLYRSAIGRCEGMASTLLLHGDATGSRVTGHLGTGLIRNIRVTVGIGELPVDPFVAAVVAVLPHHGVRGCWYLPCFFAMGGSGLDSLGWADPYSSLELSLSCRASSVGQPPGETSKGHWAHGP